MVLIEPTLFYSGHEMNVAICLYFDRKEITVWQTFICYTNFLEVAFEMISNITAKPTVCPSICFSDPYFKF